MKFIAFTAFTALFSAVAFAQKSGQTDVNRLAEDFARNIPMGDIESAAKLAKCSKSLSCPGASSIKCKPGDMACICPNVGKVLDACFPMSNLNPAKCSEAEYKGLVDKWRTMIADDCKAKGFSASNGGSSQSYSTFVGLVGIMGFMAIVFN